MIADDETGASLFSSPRWRKAANRSRGQKARFGLQPLADDAGALLAIRSVKALGLLGSTHDGEVLNAARHAERLRADLDLTWADLIVSEGSGLVHTRRAALAAA